MQGGKDAMHILPHEYPPRSRESDREKEGEREGGREGESGREGERQREGGREGGKERERGKLRSISSRINTPPRSRESKSKKE